MTEVERLIQARSDRNKASVLSESGWIVTNLTKEQLPKHKNKYKHRQRFGVGQKSGSETKGPEPARSQEPSAEALKIQEVQEIDIRR